MVLTRWMRPTVQPLIQEEQCDDDVMIPPGASDLVIDVHGQDLKVQLR